MGKEETPGTPPAAVPMLNISMTDFEAMMSRIMAAAGGQANLSVDQTMAMEAMKNSVLQTQMLRDELQRTVTRSNADHRHMSAFDFDVRCERCKAGVIHEETGHYGHPKHALIHETYFCFGKQTDEQLTAVEIELFNSFTESTECRDGLWKATISRHSKSKQRLHVEVPALTIDDLSSLPPLDQILMELLYGRKVVDPVITFERIKELEARLATLEAEKSARKPAVAGAKP